MNHGKVWRIVLCMVDNEPWNLIFTYKEFLVARMLLYGRWNQYGQDLFTPYCQFFYIELTIGGILASWELPWR